MTNHIEIEQANQENEYWFPYHYVAQFKNNRFKHFFLDSWSINYVSTIEFLLKNINIDSAKRIVDIGCGDGRFSRELSLVNPNSSVVGIDYSKRAIALASAMNPDIANLQFQSIDITKENELAPFDSAVLMEVFEHIPIESADHFMSSVRNLVREGGVLYLTVPHENKPVEYKHFQHFSVEKIINYLHPHFEVVEVVPFEKISWTRKLIFLTLNNRFFILNSQRILSMIYRWYKAHLFFCSSEKDCQRIFVKAVAK